MTKNELIDEMLKLNNKCIMEQRDFTQSESEYYDLLDSELRKIEKQEKRQTEWRCEIDSEIRKEDDTNMNTQEFRNFLNDTNQRLFVEERAVNTTLKAENGAVVQQTVSDMVVKKLQEISMLFGESRMFTGVNGELSIPVENAQNLISATFVGEDNALSVNKLIFSAKKLVAKRVGCAVCLTDNLVLDAGFGAVDYVVQLLAERLSVGIENSILNGQKDKGEFEGILAHEAMPKMTVSAVSSDSIIELTRALHPAYTQNAKMVMNRKTFQALSKLTDGAGQYLMVFDFAREKPVYICQGHEVVVSQNMPDGKILFVSPQHALATLIKGGVRVRRVAEDSDNALRGTQLFVCDMFVDTVLVNPDACMLLETEE